MKILYIVPNINTTGGVARVLSVKTDYLIRKWNYKIEIMTQNGGDFPLFYTFNKNIVVSDIPYSKQKVKFLFQFRKELLKKIHTSKPDCIVVSDNGFKAYLIPLLIKTNIPIIFEAHGSKFNEEKKSRKIFFQKIIHKITNVIKIAGAKKFDLFVALSSENSLEWNIKNGVVIPNPIWIETKEINSLEAKKVIAVSRHSYEKGLDRLLKIWKEIIERHPDWELDIYGEFAPEMDVLQLAKELKIENSVHFYLPVPNIVEKYYQASIYVMTSRFEGFPMVLLEAMTCGLPVVAYDCPVGPRSILSHNIDGFLIENDNMKEFVEKLSLLIDNENKRKEFGMMGRKNIQHYNLDVIMDKWNLLFQSLKK